MKKMDKFILFIFSIIILAMVVLFCLTYGFGIISKDLLVSKISIVSDQVTYGKMFSFANDSNSVVAYITISVMIVLGLFALKGIFLQSKTEKVQDGIMLENNSGKLLISRQTLEKLVSDISKDVPGTESAKAQILINRDNKLMVMTDVIVYNDASIKDVSKRLQDKVKASLKQASDLEVAEVNVNVASVSNKRMPKEHINMLAEYKAKEENDKNNEEVKTENEASEEDKTKENKEENKEDKKELENKEESGK